MVLALTPNLGLQKPTPGPGGTTGPEWAQELNTALDLIDAHDHSSGKGAPITTGGININADLEFNGFRAIELKGAILEDQGAALTDPVDKAEIYNVNGDLYWNNGSGAAVQITSGSGLASSISGAFNAAAPGAYPYDVTSADAQSVLLVDTTSARTINLPAATTAVLFCIKDETGTADTYNITVTPDGTDTIDSTAGSKVLQQPKGFWLFISDGIDNWSFADLSPDYIPASSLMMTLKSTAPIGWLLCDGSAVSRTTYSRLFAIIGSDFVSGDGSTTFNLPDLRQRFPLGKAASGTGATLGGTGGSINHTHSVPAHYHGMGTDADLVITASGSHSHSIDHDHPSVTSSSNGAHQHFVSNTDFFSDTLKANNQLAGSFDAGGGDPNYAYDLHGNLSAADKGLTSSNGAHTHSVDVPEYNGISGTNTHTHGSVSFAGRIGLVAGGVDGNSAMTSGTNNPPFMAVNFIIKY